MKPLYFGKEHVISRSNVNKRLNKLVNHYYNNVYNKANRKTSKGKYEPNSIKGLRTLNNVWKHMTIKYKTEIPIYSLLDIGSKTDKLTGPELDFYNDQKINRLLRMSEEIDKRHPQCFLQEQQIQKELEIQEERYEYSDEECTTDINKTRSGTVRVDIQSTRNDSTSIPPPKLRYLRNCTNEVKSACLQVSVNCGISANLAIIAVQTVCKALYNHEFYLTKEEAIAKDTTLISHRNTEEETVQKCKRQKLMTHNEQKPPRSKNDYLLFTNVLPSVRTINNYKQLLAVQAEADAAKTLYNIPEEVKCNLHYDTTSRCKIDGEWPAIIFSFSNGHRYNLRPIFFAYEDRAQIVSLLAETYRRLALCIIPHSQEIEMTAKDLWKKTSTIMTDSVEKNLHIEDGIATALGSEHKPLHMLCKAHTVEALDRSNINVLAQLEHKLKFREALESINPAVKSFLRGEKSVAMSAIKTILNFVSHDKSSTSTNQADLFDYILQREKKVKHLSLYQERRFTKLGYSCSSILDALPYIRMVLAETHLSNQHVEIVQMFLDSELLCTELYTLSYFTYKVSLPLLYAVEICTQDELCEIFPKLHKDLLEGSLETLVSYVIEYRHIKIQPPSTNVELQLIKEMCSDAAKTIERQCGREYGFGIYKDCQNRPRATEIHKLPSEERKKLEITSNIPAERHLAVFDRRSVVAKYRNYKFKAKSLRNYMVLHQYSFENTPNKTVKKIAAILNQRESEWSKEQQILHRLKIEEKIKRAKNLSQYTNKLLLQCKSWKGPVISIYELTGILNAKPDMGEQIVRRELSYYRNTHKSDVIASPTLFKLNKITHEERLTNLCVLLGGMNNRSFIVLPRNEDALTALKDCNAKQDDDSLILEINQICVTL